MDKDDNGCVPGHGEKGDDKSNPHILYQLILLHLKGSITNREGEIMRSSNYWFIPPHGYNDQNWAVQNQEPGVPSESLIERDAGAQDSNHPLLLS